MSEVVGEISDDFKFAYFTSSNDKKVNIGEQNHHNQKWSEGSDMNFKPNFNFSTFECPKQELILQLQDTWELD